jgi:hypothetical protein
MNSIANSHVPNYMYRDNNADTHQRMAHTADAFESEFSDLAVLFDSFHVKKASF